MIRTRRARWWLVGGSLALMFLAVWLSFDLADSSPHDLRRFDGHEVGRLETAMWRSYYDHRRTAMFLELGALLRQQYHLPFWQSEIGAYHAARAAVVFQRGHKRADYMLALPDLDSYYSIIRRHSETAFDVSKVARSELEWWIVHRERAQNPPGALEAALAQLQAQIYGRPAVEFGAHAKARAEAMLLRDARAEGGGAPSESDWARIEGLLDECWVGLQNVVSR